MPSSNTKKRAPKTSRKKKAVFTFHLLQPFFQFLALVAVMIAFTRCSPLAPSTDKAGFGSNSGPIATGPAAAGAVLEQAIQESLAEVSSHDAKIVSETEFRNLTEGTLSADDSIEERDAKSLFDQRRRGMGLRRPGKILYVTLPADRLATLVKDGKIRVDLNERLARANDKGRHAFYKNLLKLRQDNSLDATGYLVMPDSTMKRVQNGFDELSLPLKVSFGAPSEEQAYLEIRRDDEESAADETNAALLDAAVREARSLAIVLE